MAGSSLGLYVVSLFLPALHFVVGGSEPRTVLGLEAAALGWSALFVPNFGWLANLAYALGLILMLVGLRRVSTALAAVAVLLGLQSLMLFGVPIDNESGSRQMLLSRLGLGYFTWMAALVVLVAGAPWATPARRLGASASAA